MAASDRFLGAAESRFRAYNVPRTRASKGQQGATQDNAVSSRL